MGLVLRADIVGRLRIGSMDEKFMKKNLVFQKLNQITFIQNTATNYGMSIEVTWKFVIWHSSIWNYASSIESQARVK